MNGFGGRIKRLRARVTSGLLVLSAAGTLLAGPAIGVAKASPPGSGGSITGHKIKS